MITLGFSKRAHRSAVCVICKGARRESSLHSWWSDLVCHAYVGQNKFNPNRGFNIFGQRTPPYIVKSGKRQGQQTNNLFERAENINPDGKCSSFSPCNRQEKLARIFWPLSCLWHKTLSL
jgi:hypothetical protein